MARNEDGEFRPRPAQSKVPMGNASPRCWKSEVEFVRETFGSSSPEYQDALDHPSTCMKNRGHEGPHRWTFDGDITFIPRGGRHGEV